MDTSFNPQPDASAPRTAAPDSTKVVQPGAISTAPGRRRPTSLLEANTPAEIAAVVSAQELDAPKPVRPRRVKALAPFRATVDLQLAPATVQSGYAPRVLDDVFLDAVPQQVALKLLTSSLIANQAELTDGTRVTRPQQAIQWILDQIAIATPADVLDQLLESAA
jgi:hypothetical protein